MIPTKQLKKFLATLASVALAAALSVPAFAADRTDDMAAGGGQTATDADGNSVTTEDRTGALEPGDHFNVDTVITADVKASAPNVISVTLPTTMSIAIGTKYKPIAGGGRQVVFDAANTRAVEAGVRNRSKGSAVDISVARVAETPAGALATLLLKLTPVSPSAASVAGGGVDLLTSTADAGLIAGLPGLAGDGAGTPGEATLTLSTGMADGAVLDSMAGKSATVAATLKVAATAAP